MMASGVAAQQSVAPPGESSCVLAVRHLRKQYETKSDERVLALDDISMELHDREFVSVLGASGCGKTTLLKILAGIIPYAEGEILFRSAPLRGPQSGMGIVFQSPVLLPWLTVLDNVMLPIRVLNLGREAYLSRARDLLRLVGLADFERKYPNELSGGMQQRVAIVRGLIHDPTLLLMDEPFGALDALTRERMNVELQRIWLADPKTVFLITHSIPEAIFLSDRILVMSPRPGRIVEEVPIPFARPRNLDITGSAEFGRLTQHLRNLLGGGDGHAGF
jgi:NitT/TauT family transport system ATP-binding protein